MEKKHISTLDFLRGIAALAVVLFHYSNSTLPTIKPNPLGDVFSFGYLGVQVFFVISGFVIPFSMYQSGYTLNNFHRFIGKRMIRLGPPSYIAMGLMACIFYGSLWKNGYPIEEMNWPGMGLSTVFGNMFYTYESLDIKVFYSVLWTLEVELQFYLIIALILPLLTGKQNTPLVAAIVLIGLSCTFFIGSDHVLFFKYSSLFIMGLLVFLFQIKLTNGVFTAVGSIAIGIITYLQLDLLSAIAGISTVLVILFLKIENKATKFLGMISYSLYITHHFSGITAEFIVKKSFGEAFSGTEKTVLLFVYCLIAIGFATVFYKLVERPFINLSGKLKFKPNKSSAST